MFGAMRIVVVAAIVVVTSAVRADPIPAKQAGPQVAPPVAADPVLPQDLDGRHAVRGCAVGDGCVRPADALREFELERFPKAGQNLNVPGQSPWLHEPNSAPSRPEPAQT